MNLERWLQVHLIALCVLGSLFVAISTGSFGMTAAVLFSGIASIVLTDAMQCFRLHRVLANVVAVAAVMISLYHFFGGGLNSQLKAIANLLVYLQLILFFQDKTDRIYWHLILLSLLQVVVGAALDLGMVFGILLGAYAFLSLTALILFFLQRESQSTITFVSLNGNSERNSARASGSGTSSGASSGNAAEMVDPAGPTLSYLGMRNAIYIAIGAMVFAAVYFHTSPRHPDFSYAMFRGQGRTQSGFSRELELQQMGEMLQSNEPVMRVWLETPRHEPLKRFEPYFAGEVLPVYEPMESKWKVSQVRRDEIEEIDQEGDLLDPAPPGSFYQHLHVRSSNLRSLYTVAPAYAIPNVPLPLVRRDRASGLAFRRLPVESYLYPDMKISLATTGVVSNYQPALTPVRVPQNRAERFRWMMQLEETADFDEHRFAGLARVAREFLDVKLVDASNPYVIAKTLESHFHTPGLYRYSLNMNLPRDRNLDPVEDFATNHRVGHCQYFASALVMMLRSCGVPARMVVGYRGYDYNESFHYYQVQQRHAHAWVEAYIPPASIPENEPAGGKLTEGGAWLRLEPTPTSDENSAALAQNWLGTARDWLDYFDFVWSDYVVGLNTSKQQAAWGPGWFGNDQEPSQSTWRERWKTIAAWLGIHFGDGAGGIRFDWRASVTAMVLAALLLLLYRGIARLLRHWEWRRDWGWRPRDPHRPKVPFYIRLEKFLARDGYERGLAQTPLEYTEHCALLVDDHARISIRRIVSAYYRVCYGGEKLEPPEMLEIDEALQRLEQSLAGRK